MQKQIEENLIEDILFKLELRYEEMNQCYWEMIDQTDNDVVKLRALNGLIGLTSRRVKMLERFGIIYREEIIRRRRQEEPDALDPISEALKEIRAEEREDNQSEL